jgi:sugar/nucleoside kinase (ribokinase family)
MNDGPRPVCVIGNANLDLVAGSVSDWPAWGTEVFFQTPISASAAPRRTRRSFCTGSGHETGLISARGEDEPGEMIATNIFAGPWIVSPSFRKERQFLSVFCSTGGERSFFSTEGHLDGLDAEILPRGARRTGRLDGALALVSGGFALPGIDPMSLRTYSAGCRAQGSRNRHRSWMAGGGLDEAAIRSRARVDRKGGPFVVQ